MLKPSHTLPFKVGGWKDLFRFLKADNVKLQHLFDKKYREHFNIVKYLYNLKQQFSILTYKKM